MQIMITSSTVSPAGTGHVSAMGPEHSATPDDQLAELICGGHTHQVSPQRRKQTIFTQNWDETGAKAD
jgi:hypothetical protein